MGYATQTWILFFVYMIMMMLIANVIFRRIFSTRKPFIDVVPFNVIAFLLFFAFFTYIANLLYQPLSLVEIQTILETQCEYDTDQIEMIISGGNFDVLNDTIWHNFDRTIICNYRTDNLWHCDC